MTKTRKQMEGEIVEKAMKDEQFREKLLSNPKGALEETFGTKFPEEMNIHVNKESANDVYVTLPYNTEELSEEELTGVSGGWAIYHQGCNLTGSGTLGDTA